MAQGHPSLCEGKRCEAVMVSGAAHSSMACMLSSRSRTFDPGSTHLVLAHLLLGSGLVHFCVVSPADWFNSVHDHRLMCRQNCISAS